MNAGLPTKIKGPIFSSHAAGLLLLSFVALTASAQSTFQNLDFEQASISVPPPAQVSTSAALPGWTVYFNGSQSDTIDYDTITLDQWDVSIHDSKTHYYSPIAGLFSVLLQGGRAPGNVFGAGEIAQTGSVDSGSRSLLFSAKLGGSGFEVSFKGQPLPIYALASSANFTQFGADISQFVGQTGELRFSSPYGASAYLDDIQFSSQVVPEPSTITLLAAGAAILSGRLTHRRK
jgi:hypothetical protein